MQKVIAILYLVLAMAGSFYPCCLDDDCASELTQTQDQSREEQSDKGFCSPFSACASCAASVDIATLNFTVIEPLMLPLEYGAYKAATGEEVYSSLFQPPRSC